MNSAKHMTKRLLVLALCGLGLLAVLILLSPLVFPKFNAAEKDLTQQSALAITAEPSDSLDAIVVGDSEPKSALSPLHMYNEYGFTSYVCATFSQRPHIGFSMLRTALENQHPQVVLIETNVFYNDKYTVSNGVMQCIEDLLPVFKYHDRWKNLTAADFDFSLYEWTEDPAKGYYVNTTVKPANSNGWMKQTSELKTPLPMSEFYLRTMVAYCKSKGATPVLLSVPSTTNMNDAKHNALQALADDMGIDYIDLNEGDTKVDVQWETESRDGGDHLNYAGAIRASHTLGGILAQRYQLPDHRGDPLYQHWGEAYQEFIQNYPLPQQSSASD